MKRGRNENAEINFANTVKNIYKVVFVTNALLLIILSTFSFFVATEYMIGIPIFLILAYVNFKWWMSSRRGEEISPRVKIFASVLGASAIAFVAFLIVLIIAFSGWNG